MNKAHETAQELNKPYADLYGDSLALFVQLPPTATLNDIIQVVNSNNIIGYTHKIMVGNKCVIAKRKYTYLGKRSIKTQYCHIYHVTSFENPRVLTHWKETSEGNFKTV